MRQTVGAIVSVRMPLRAVEPGSGSFCQNCIHSVDFGARPSTAGGRMRQSRKALAAAPLLPYLLV
jgi:hypothetical protein